MINNKFKYYCKSDITFVNIFGEKIKLQPHIHRIKYECDMISLVNLK